MKKYVTRRQLKAKKRKKIVFVIEGIIVLCLIGFIVSFVIEHSGKTLSNTNKYGSESLVNSDPKSIPDYTGEDYIILNEGKPNFNEWDLKNINGEHYSDIDSLGRCGKAYALLDKSMMPSEERGEIGQIKPSGWIQKKYEGIVDAQPPYLYNRCHLIAYALTGQNANIRNLITGSRYMNATTMLSWEKKVVRYLDNSVNHVLYRVTPYFKGRDLLARGVEIEAYSVEDKGEGICFHVFLYNIQPGIVLDYSTGESKVKVD